MTAHNIMEHPRTPPPPPAVERVAGPYRPTLHTWTFNQLLRVQDDDGRIGGHRVELLDGNIFDMAAQKNAHWIAVNNITAMLQRHLPHPYYTGSQGTHYFDEHSAPEPDVNVLPNVPPAEGYERPDAPVLIVEVSDTTLAHERAKASLYAAHGVNEYWIVNLSERRVEVYRNPIVDREHEHGWRYQKCEIVNESASVAPQVKPDPPLQVSAMLR